MKRSMELLRTIQVLDPGFEDEVLEILPMEGALLLTHDPLLPPYMHDNEMAELNKSCFGLY